VRVERTEWRDLSGGTVNKEIEPKLEVHLIPSVSEGPTILIHTQRLG